MTFQMAVEMTRHLRHAWRPGLEALRARDRKYIEVEDSRRLTGSIDVDTACRRADPDGNRWDFGIAYEHQNRTQEVFYWVETHTASDSQVGTVIRKAQWLQRWFRGDGRRLARFERDIVWISSGPTTFTLAATQRKQMSEAGLRTVGSRLRIRNGR
jgi:hypothetical protein